MLALLRRKQNPGGAAGQGWRPPDRAERSAGGLRDDGQARPRRTAKRWPDRASPWGGGTGSVRHRRARVRKEGAPGARRKGRHRRPGGRVGQTGFGCGPVGGDDHVRSGQPFVLSGGPHRRDQLDERVERTAPCREQGDDGDPDGWRVPHPSDALVGPTADASIRSLYFDVLFLGVHGLDPVAGLTTPNISEAETNRTFISRCRRVVVVADHTKWRTTALCTMADLSDVDTLVTDDGLPEEARRQLRNQIGEVVIAPGGQPT